MPSKPPADSDASAVRLRGVELRYGETPVLDGVDLEVQSGEVLALMGPSGCGKTTLLHLVMKLLAPSAGEVEVRSERVAMVFQKPQLLPWLDVVDNAAFGLECRGVALKEARPRARELLERMRLGEALTARPHELSEGMKQRVNLARALLVEPELLLMDEPFSALDITTRDDLWTQLLDLWSERGFSVIFVSHALEEVAFLADRVALFSDKPTTLRRLEPIDLPRPRALTDASLHARVASLRQAVMQG